MTTVRQIVNVSITRQINAFTQAGFGLPMFLGLHKGFTERFRKYTSVTEVAADFSTSSNEYLAASIAFSQTPSVAEFAIGRQDSTTVTYTPVVANSATYTVTVNGTLFSFVSDSSATAAEIVTGLTSLINADVALPVTASGSTTLILTADVGGVPFSAKASTNLTPVYATTESLTNALVAVNTENDTWFGLGCYSHVKADQLEVAAWALSNKRLYGTSSTDTNIINQAAGTDTTSVVYALKAAANDWSFVIYSAEAAKFPEMGLMGSQLAEDVGARTWTFKTINGITADKLTTTQSGNAQAKNCITYENIGGKNQTYQGKTCEGTFCDIIRNQAWIQARMQERIFALLSTSDVAFDDDGIAAVEGQIHSVLWEGMDKGIIARDPLPSITVPKRSAVPVADRTNRFLSGCKWEATIRGFVESVSVSGILTV